MMLSMLIVILCMVLMSFRPKPNPSPRRAEDRYDG